jgi:hypothetical protein
MTPRDVSLAGLGVISLALLAVIAMEAFQTPAPATAAAPAQATRLPAAAVDDVSGFVPIIVARPLFAPDRRPKAGPAVAGAPSDDMPRLAGIMIERTQRRAIFQPSGDGKPVTLVEGDQVAGWKVQQIAADGVTLTGPKGTQTLQPKADPSLAAAAASSGDPMAPGGAPRPAPNNPRQFLPGGMQLPAGVPNPFVGQAAPPQGRPAVPQPASRQPGGAPAAPNRR